MPSKKGFSDMIPKEKLVRIVQKMVAETGTRGIKTMCQSVGLEWKDVCDTVSDNFGEPDGSHRHPAQLAMDFLMLGASIGYLFAKGENIRDDSYDSIV